MLELLGSVLLVFTLMWGVIYIHELGHYIAGRRIVGIPGSEIKFVAPYFPRYVAFRNGEEWVSPSSFERYWELFEAYDPDGEHRERYAAAGELVQATVVVPVSLAIGMTSPQMGLTVAIVSVSVAFVYVAIDAIATQSRGRPSGDYSVLWQAGPGPTFFLLFGFLSVHVLVFLVLT